MTTMLLPAPSLGICYNTSKSIKHNILETIKYNVLETIKHNVLETSKHYLIWMRTSLCRVLRLTPQSPQSIPKVQREVPKVQNACVAAGSLAQQRDIACASHHQRPETTCSIKAAGLRVFLHIRTSPCMAWNQMLQAPQAIHLLQNVSVVTGALVYQTDMIRVHLDRHTKSNIAVTPALRLDQSASQHDLWNTSLNLNLPQRLVPDATYPRSCALVFCRVDVIPPACRDHD
jgi:hypothetical protein